VAAAAIDRTRKNVTDLSESTAPRNPLQLFQSWFVEARQHPEILLPEAMTLATADHDRRPSARMVLLKSYDEQGFVFYTNYNSRKARELEANPLCRTGHLLGAARLPGTS
jgi:Pyridoxamine-phosphate oxidase